MAADTQVNGEKRAQAVAAEEAPRYARVCLGLAEVITSLLLWVGVNHWLPRHTATHWVVLFAGWLAVQLLVNPLANVMIALY